ncbi:unnamed protein product, partial [Amoebophrya sp. A25]|eukprot:GSA25T00017448001.1
MRLSSSGRAVGEEVEHLPNKPEVGAQLLLTGAQKVEEATKAALAYPSMAEKKGEGNGEHHQNVEDNSNKMICHAPRNSKHDRDDELGIHIMLSAMLHRREQEKLKEVILRFDPLAEHFFFNEKRKFAFMTASSPEARDRLLQSCRRYAKETHQDRIISRRVTVCMLDRHLRDHLYSDWKAQRQSPNQTAILRVG